MVLLTATMFLNSVLEISRVFIAQAQAILVAVLGN